MAETLKKKTQTRNRHRLVVSNTIAKSKEFLPPVGTEAPAEIKPKLESFINIFEKQQRELEKLELKY